MRLTRQEFERIGTAPPLELFLQGIKAEATRDKYTRTLRQVLCKVLDEILDGTFEERAAQLVRYGREDPEMVRDILINISRLVKKRTQLPRNHPDYYNPSSVDNYFKPVKKLLDMNDVTIPWKRIYVTFPELDNVSATRGWTRGEIQTMLKFSKGTVDRAIVLLAASSGIRSGGFDLNWGDMEPVYKGDDGLTFERHGEPVCGNRLGRPQGLQQLFSHVQPTHAPRAHAGHQDSEHRHAARRPQAVPYLALYDGPAQRPLGAVVGRLHAWMCDEREQVPTF